MNGRAAALAAPASLLALGALRFHEYVLGGSVVFRDAGFFFVPWRLLTARLLSGGSLPLWNPWASSGRALAADPNGAVFWPPTLLVPLVGTTGLFLVHVGLVLATFFAALRWLGLSRGAAAAGGAVVLFSGVFQTVPLLYTTVASAAPLPLAVVALSGIDPAAPREIRRRVAVAGLALGLSFLGGEPFITASGALAAVAVSGAGALRDRRQRRSAAVRLASLAAAGALALAIAAIQLAPALGELTRSERTTGMRPEDGALFWSVRPSRLLTLLEPRLSGDPFAEEPERFWGASTFDAGNPYFYDLALGVLPLGLAAVAFADRRGRGALALAFAAALLSLGRHAPGLDLPGRLVPFFRYPEKWWLLATFALAAAAAVGWDRLEREPAAGRPLSRTLLLAAGALGGLVVLALAAPAALRGLLWAAGLGSGPASPDAVRTVLLPSLASGLAVAVGGAVVAQARVAGRVPAGASAAILAVLFLLDAGRRVAGTCPAGPPGLHATVPDEVALVLAETAGRGRFHDEGADDPGRAVARVLARNGFDPLRPLTGAIHGVAYSGENDIDRLTPRETTAWVRRLVRLPWGEQKLRLLAGASVRVVRTSAPGPDPGGVVEIARVGPDRFLRVAAPRPFRSLLRTVRFVGTGESGRAAGESSAPADEAFVEDPVAAGQTLRPGGGEVEVLEARPASERLRLRVAPGGGLLLVTRTFDPSWRAALDGAPLAPLRADGPFTAYRVPAGEHEVFLRYSNGLLRAGAAATLAGLLVAGLLLARRTGGAR